MAEPLMNRITASPIGGALFRVIKPMIGFVRRRFNPDVPEGFTDAIVRYGGKTLSLRHRRWNQDDLLAIKQCFTLGQYDMPSGKQGGLVKHLYQDILARGRKPLIVDCGANIGASVRWFSLRYPEAHLIAIEPAPSNCALLRQNTLGLDVDIREGGIGPSDGQAYLINRHGDAAMGYEVTSEPNDHPVPLFSIASLLAESSGKNYEPFLLKIDIEGGEKDLFSGDTSSINRFPFIVMEPHDWLHPGEKISSGFFRFHIAHEREFAVKDENVASLALDRVTMKRDASSRAEVS